MKKTLIALAVAGAFAAPAMAATSNVDVYGKLRFSVDFADTNNLGGADGSDVVTGQDNASRLGFKGSEDLGGGLKAVWQIEQALNAGISQGGTMASRNTFVGLAGDFGTVIIGRHDTPYKLATGSLDPFADSIGDYNNLISRNNAGANNFDLRAPGTIAYISPTISGFHAAVAYVEAKNVEAAGADNLRAWSLAGIYSNGPLFGSLAYETHSGAFGGWTATAVDKEEAWKLGLGYTFGDTKVGLVYEDVSHDAALSAIERDAFVLNLTHNIGPIALIAAYGQADNSKASATDEADYWALGADYKLSKRTKVWAYYSTIGNDPTAAYSMNNYTAVAGQDVDALSIGIEHNF